VSPQRDHPADGGVEVDLFEWTDEDPTPENACINYNRCGNVVPASGQMCGKCLDKLRHQESNARSNPVPQ
jgi:hypothetical protein